MTTMIIWCSSTGLPSSQVTHKPLCYLFDVENGNAKAGAKDFIFRDPSYQVAKKLHKNYDAWECPTRLL